MERTVSTLMVQTKNYKSNIGEFNFLGLPIRKGEKECPYYMRTVSCKSCSNCRFHHPEPSPGLQTDSPFGYGNGGGSLPSELVSSPTVSSWSSPRAFNDTSPFTSAMFLPTKGVAASNTTWNRNQEDMVLEEYPERPGEPECSFFLKTGDCKFKSNCKFHHPKNRISNAKAYSLALNNKGLPLRPDQPLCTFYPGFGICKYGPVCRYDHPSDFAILPPTFHQQLFGN